MSAFNTHAEVAVASPDWRGTKRGRVLRRLGGGRVEVALTRAEALDALGTYPGPLVFDEADLTLVRAAWQDMTDGALVAEWRRGCAEGALGVDYYLAQEMEARGLLSRRTRDLTAKGRKAEPEPVCPGCGEPRERCTAVYAPWGDPEFLPADHVKGGA